MAGNQTYVHDMTGMTLRVDDLEANDLSVATVTTSDIAVTDDLAVTGDTTLAGILALNLTNIPEYADQAAGAAALAAGRVFRVPTTGALHVALS